MKNYKFIIGLITIVIVAVIYVVVTNKNQVETTTDNHGHDHGSENAHKAHETNDGHDDHDESDHGADKLIHLNEAQYKNADIDTGWFQMKNLNEVIHANGYTKLPPQNQADVSVFISGMVKNIHVIEGQYIKKGQVLAVVESPEFTILQEDYLKTKSNLAYLELEFDRQNALRKENVNAEKVFQKIKSELDIERARFNSLKRQLKILNVNGDGNTLSSVPIVAPISGNITEVFIKIGSSVEPNKPLFSIVDNSEMHIDLLVYEKDLSKVKKGQKVRFVLTNQSNKEIMGTIFNIGKSFENETKTVAVHADIENEDENELIPGMYVNALIDVGNSEVSALPDASIVLAEGREFIFVYEKENDTSEEVDDHHDHDHGDKTEGHDHGDHESVKRGPKEISFARVEVKTGPSKLGFTEVTLLMPIHDGDKIVTKGAYYLQSHLQKSEGGGGHSH